MNYYLKLTKISKDNVKDGEKKKLDLSLYLDPHQNSMGFILR